MLFTSSSEQSTARGESQHSVEQPFGASEDLPAFSVWGGGVCWGPPSPGFLLGWVWGTAV